MSLPHVNVSVLTDIVSKITVASLGLFALYDRFFKKKTIQERRYEDEHLSLQEKINRNMLNQAVGNPFRYPED